MHRLELVTVFRVNAYISTFYFIRGYCTVVKAAYCIDLLIIVGYCYQVNRPILSYKALSPQLIKWPCICMSGWNPRSSEFYILLV